ncbi:MAG: hypothetical protein PHD37_06385 [Gallionellaceae bacterium]|nr:hypothetical protein [Gallionellaceae bacterium]
MNIDEALIAADEFLPLLKWQQNGGVIPIALYVLATEVRRQRDEIGKLRSALAVCRIGGPLRGVLAPTHTLMEIIDHNGVPLMADPFKFMGEGTT